MQRTDPLRGEANRSLATLAPLGFTLVEVMVALAVVVRQLADQYRQARPTW